MWLTATIRLERNWGLEVVSDEKVEEELQREEEDREVEALFNKNKEWYRKLLIGNRYIYI